MADAAADISQHASRLPLRLRERIMPFGIVDGQAFELESIALANAVMVFAIQGSRFDDDGRDSLQDESIRAYADRMLRLRLTGNTFMLRPPLDALAAAEKMRQLQIKSHDRLDLQNLYNFLCSRLSTYSQESPNGMIEKYLGYLEMKREFELVFSLAVFLTDSADLLRQRLDRIWRTSYLS